MLKQFIFREKCKGCKDKFNTQLYVGDILYNPLNQDLWVVRHTTENFSANDCPYDAVLWDDIDNWYEQLSMLQGFFLYKHPWSFGYKALINRIHNYNKQAKIFLDGHDAND